MSVDALFRSHVALYESSKDNTLLTFRERFAPGGTSLRQVLEGQGGFSSLPGEGTNRIVAYLKEVYLFKLLLLLELSTFVFCLIPIAYCIRRTRRALGGHLPHLTRLGGEIRLWRILVFFGVMGQADMQEKHKTGCFEHLDLEI